MKFKTSVSCTPSIIESKEHEASNGDTDTHNGTPDSVTGIVDDITMAREKKERSRFHMGNSRIERAKGVIRNRSRKGEPSVQSRRANRVKESSSDEQLPEEVEFVFHDIGILESCRAIRARPRIAERIHHPAARRRSDISLPDVTEFVPTASMEENVYECMEETAMEIKMGNHPQQDLIQAPADLNLGSPHIRSPLGSPGQQSPGPIYSQVNLDCKTGPRKQPFFLGRQSKRRLTKEHPEQALITPPAPMLLT